MYGHCGSRRARAPVRLGLAAAALAAWLVALAGCSGVGFDSVGTVTYRVDWGPVSVDGTRTSRIVKCTEGGKCTDVGAGPTVGPALPIPQN